MGVPTSDTSYGTPPPTYPTNANPTPSLNTSAATSAANQYVNYGTANQGNTTLADPIAPVSQYHPFDPTTDPAYLERSKEFGFGQALNQQQVQMGPAFLASQATQQNNATDILAQQASQAAQSGYLNQNYNLQMAGLGVDQAANARQPGFLTNLHNIANQGYQAQADQARRALNSQLTARGAFTSIGGNQGRADITGNLGLQTGAENARYNENMAQVNDQAAKLGITGEQYKNMLGQGLDRLNLSTAMSVGDLLNQNNQSTIQDAMMRQKMWGDALNASDYFSTQYPGYQSPGANVPNTVSSGGQLTHGGG